MYVSDDTARQAGEEALAWLDNVDAGFDAELTLLTAVSLAKAGGLTAELAARVVACDLARAFIAAAKKAVETGVIPPGWDRLDRKQVLVTTGLQRYDPRVAFQATVRTAYGAGRYERAMASKKPFLVYRSMRDRRVRPWHRAIDGVTLPKDDAWWDTHYPPNGWRCRCKAYPADAGAIQDLVDAGVKVQREVPDEPMVPYTNKTTGETKELPASIDPGWDFNPGKEAHKLEELLRNRMAMLAMGL
jgi:SPP1 gp7 family putative phage head morphogenesis protein